MAVIRIKSQPIFGLPNTKKEPLVNGKLCKPALTYTIPTCYVSGSLTTVTPALTYTIPTCSASGSLTTVTPALTYAYSTSVA